MLRRLKTSSLVLGSALASALNFFSFVLLPARTGTAGIGEFARDNYLGGLYLAAIVSSVSPMSVFILAYERATALRRYAVLSALGFLAVLLAWPFMGSAWSMPCLLGAALMHCAGFMLALLIYEGRVVQAALLQTLQQLVFSVLLASCWLAFGDSGPRWSLLYLLSTMAAATGFALAAPWARLREILREPAVGDTTWAGLMLRMVLCVSFALFFQIELILCGEFTAIKLGEYTILQKLYSSVSTSLFGSLGTVMLMRQAREGHGASPVTAQSVKLGSACAVTVVAVGAVLMIAGKNASAVDPAAVAASALVAFLFTLASFANLTMQNRHPRRSLSALVIALGLYVAAFAIAPPATAFQMLLLGGGFFATFMLLIAFNRMARPSSA